MTEDPSEGQELRTDRQGARRFPTAGEDSAHSRLDPNTPQTASPAYRLGFADPDFLLRDELRAARLELEFLKPDLLQKDRGIVATVAVFGSARIPAPEDVAALLEKAELAAARDPANPLLAMELRRARALVDKGRYYEEARRLARMIAASEGEGPDAAQDSDSALRPQDPATEPADACRLYHGRASVVIVTGGGPGIMEAANRGAHDVDRDNIGLNIVLPREQAPNPYITPHLCFNFHYYALRKMHFLLRAVALVVFPGGFGTLDELFELLTLIQTGKIEPMPVLLFGREYWGRIIDFQALVDEGMIGPEDLEIFTYVETAEEAWRHLEPVLATVREQT